MKEIAVAILENQKGEILLMQRDNNPAIPFPGTWDLIGGHIEKNETPEEAARREAKEEIGIDLAELVFWRRYNVQEGDVYPNTKHIFIGKVPVPIEELKRGEGQELRFFPHRDLFSLQFANVIGKILADYIHKRRRNL
ncbi:MAG: NUDIX domain-containing protein [Candidatus Wildermuthbacteria bacterium]|nr:NUDIX domain-containing protein [Candidatus Wildermuthbacteria bacterium]